MPHIDSQKSKLLKMLGKEKKFKGGGSGNWRWFSRLRALGALAKDPGCNPQHSWVDNILH